MKLFIKSLRNGLEMALHFHANESWIVHSVPNSCGIKNYNEAARDKRVRIACDQQSMKPNDKIWLLEHEYTNAERFWTLDNSAWRYCSGLWCPETNGMSQQGTSQSLTHSQTTDLKFGPWACANIRPDMALIIEYK